MTRDGPGRDGEREELKADRDELVDEVDVIR